MKPNRNSVLINLTYTSSETHFRDSIEEAEKDLPNIIRSLEQEFGYSNITAKIIKREDCYK